LQAHQKCLATGQFASQFGICPAIRLKEEITRKHRVTWPDKPVPLSLGDFVFVFLVKCPDLWKLGNHNPMRHLANYSQVRISYAPLGKIDGAVLDNYFSNEVGIGWSGDAQEPFVVVDAAAFD
jgi:hypothetical protein